jgi:hypothetical protein
MNQKQNDVEENESASPVRDRITGKHRVTRWEYIRRIRRSPAFAAIVFFPLMAILLRVGVDFQLVSTNVAIELQFAWPLPIIGLDRFHIFYWALFCLFLGSFVYVKFCPDMFVRYETKFDYAKTELEVLQEPAYAKNTTEFVRERLWMYENQVKRIKPRLCSDLKHAERNLYQAASDVANGRGEGARIDSNIVSELQLAHWKFMNVTHPFWRVVIWASYNCGLILISVVVMWSVAEVFLSYCGYRM